MDLQDSFFYSIALYNINFYDNEIKFILRENLTLHRAFEKCRDLVCISEGILCHLQFLVTMVTRLLLDM